MSYEIRYLPLAEDDLDTLTSYLSRFYPGTSVRVLSEMESRIAHLREHPLMCEEYANDPFYRRLVVLDYLVFYHVNEHDETVDIHRVLRGAMDIGKHLLR